MHIIKLVNLPIPECFILDYEEIDKVSQLIFKSLLFYISWVLFLIIITSCIMYKLDILLWSYFFALKPCTKTRYDLH